MIRTGLRPLLWGFAVVAVAGAAMSYLFFVEWIDVKQVVPAEVEREFAAALNESGGGTPYIEIGEGGLVVVHRELERERAPVFETLSLLAWAPGDDKLLRVDYPRWFVRLKTSSSLNLGTMIAVLRRDWEHLDLSISYADLLKRGPALLLDQRSAGGARILLWTTASGSRRDVAEPE